MKNYVQEGKTLTIPAPATAVSGAGVLVGILFGVAAYSAQAGDDLVIETQGVFDMAKPQAQAWAVGDPIYFNGTTGNATTDSTAGNVFIGVAVAVAANPSGIGRVRLNGSAPAAAEA